MTEETLRRLHPALAHDLVAALRVHLHLQEPRIRELGPYAIERRLGRGSHGVVYLATRGEERVAVKVCIGGADGGAGDGWLLDEAGAPCRVSHPNVVRLLDLGSTTVEGCRVDYLVMELVEGQTLRAFLSRHGPAPEEFTIHVALEVARALSAIHEAGLVHCDLKPENIMLTTGNEVKVMDLGVATVPASPGEPRAGFRGSLRYAAPEQIQGRLLDGRADLFALGLVLYELVTGEPPHGEGDDEAALESRLRVPLRDVTSRDPDVSPFLGRLIASLTEIRRERRSPDARELVRTLQERERSPWWRGLQDGPRGPRPSRPRLETPMVGRAAAVVSLRSAWSLAQEGPGRVVLVEGPAGIGKSRLLDEFCAEIAGGPGCILRGGFRPPGPGAADDALLAALRDGLGPGPLRAELERRLKDVILLAPAMEALLNGRPPPEREVPLGADSLAVAVQALCGSLAGDQPLVLVVEDLHLAGPESLALLASVARAVPRWRALLLLSFRPEGPVERIREFGAPVPAETHVLGPLDQEHIQEALRFLLGSPHTARELAPFLFEKAGGNPLFTLELVDQLRRGPAMRQAPTGEWLLVGFPHEVQAPGSIRDAILGSLDPLPEEQRDLLEMASCAGFEFDPAIVARALDWPMLTLKWHLGQAESRGRLVRTEGGRLRFEHHLVHEAVYESLPEDLRRSCHHLVAEAIRLEGGDRPEDAEGSVALELARQYLAAGDGESAGPFLSRALDHLRAAARHSEMLDLIERALEGPGCADGEERIRLLLRRAVTLQTVGSCDAQSRAIAAAVSEADRFGSPLHRAQALRYLGEFQMEADDHEAARVTLAEAIEIARTAGDTSGMAAGDLLVAELDIRQGRFREAAALASRVLEVMEKLGDTAGEAGAARALGTAWRRQGNVDAARSWYRRSAECYRTCGMRIQEVGCRHNLALTLARDQRIEEFRESLSLFEQMGDRMGVIAASINLGCDEREEGRFEESLDLLNRAALLAREAGTRMRESRARGNLANTLLDLGLYEQALRGFREHLEVSRLARYPVGEGIALQHLGGLLGRLGEGAAGLERIEQGRAVLQRIGARGPQHSGFYLEAEIHAFEGRSEMAEERLRQALGLAYKARGFGASHLILLARLLWDRGRNDEAIETMKEARELAGQGSNPTISAVAGAYLVVWGSLDPAEVLGVLPRVRARGSVRRRMECTFHLWRAVRDPRHLVLAVGDLDHLVANAPPEYRESMIRCVPLHAEIRTAQEGRLDGAPSSRPD